MKPSLSRRDLLKFVGGSVAGVMFTPIPWKLLDDTAIWTQNWSWIPKPPKGEAITRFTACTLCPGGCAIRARCIGGQPVALLPVPGHPAGGSLCPVGLTGHHLMYLAARAKTPVKLLRNGDPSSAAPVPLAEVIAAVSGAIGKPGRGSIAVVDGQPGRVTSGLYRNFLSAVGNARYIVVPPTDRMGLPTLSGACEAPPGILEYDAEHAEAIISFGAPLLDGWGAPGRSAALTMNLHRKEGRPLTLLQVEPRRSSTAAGASEWLPIAPGTEGILAVGIAHVLIAKHLYHRGAESALTDFGQFKRFTEAFTPARVASVTGVPEMKIAEIARLLAERKPSLAICGGDGASRGFDRSTELAIHSLNILLGALGAEGGIIARREILSAPAPLSKRPAEACDLRDVPDGSVSVLILDGAESGAYVPWSAIGKKLSGDDAVVVSLSPVLDGPALHAAYVVPSPAFLESWQESASSLHGRAAFALSAGFLPAPAGAVDAAEFVQRLAAACGTPLTRDAGVRTHEDLLKERAALLRKSKRGTVVSVPDSKESPAASFTSDEEFWEALADGAVWIDTPLKQATLPRCSILGSRHDALDPLHQLLTLPRKEGAIALTVFGLRRVAGSGNVSPLLSKMYQESTLHTSGSVVFIHPKTALLAGTAGGDDVILETPAGTARGQIRITDAIVPGAAAVEAGPSSGNGSAAELCAAERTDVTLRKA